MCQNCLAGRAIEVELHWLAWGKFTPGLVQKMEAAKPVPLNKKARRAEAGLKSRCGMQYKEETSTYHRRSNPRQLANTAKAAKEAIGTDTLEAVVDRGYFNGEKIKTCSRRRQQWPANPAFSSAANVGVAVVPIG
jgi:hypothetical protein